MGGWYEQNNVISSKQGISVDLAGTPDYPVTLISNTINRLGYGRVRADTPIGYFSLPFTGVWSTRPTSGINITKPWDHSFVSTGGESPELEAYPWS
jgi:hypothetical protein